MYGCGKWDMTFLSTNLAQIFKMFKKPPHSGQVSNWKALDAKLWSKSCMKGFARFWAQRGRIQPDLAKFKIL